MATNMQISHKRQILLACILAAVIFAATFAGTQLIGANAQTQNPDQPMPVDLGCETGAAVCDNSTHATIVTAGSATEKVQPDKFTVTVGVETNGTTAEQAASENSNETANIISVLKNLGIEEQQLSTSYYSLSPIYGAPQNNKACVDIYPPPPECQPGQNIIGYRATNSLSATLDVTGKIDAGKVIDTAIKSGANNVNGVNFFLSPEKQQQVRDGLIKDAISNARHRAEVAAQAIEMEIASVRSVNLNDINFPIPYATLQVANTAEASGTQIMPGQQEVSASVNVMYYTSSIQTNNTANSTGIDEGQNKASENAVSVARQFLLSKLPSLGIKIDDESKLHTDTVVAVTESDYRIDYSVMDQNGHSHDGYVELSNGEVTLAQMDGKSIL